MSSMAQLSLVTETLPNPDNEPVPVQPVPHPRQLKWQETEFYAFFHYGMNTYTGLEWGNCDEAETRFAPTAAPTPPEAPRKSSAPTSHPEFVQLQYLSCSWTRCPQFRDFTWF